MMTGTVLLDVNVAMYAGGAPHPYKQACAWIMMQVAAGRIDAVIDAETIQEILYRFMRTQQWQTAVDMAENLLEAVPAVLPVRLADMMLCLSLCRRYGPLGLPARDLLHAAVMQNNGVTAIISTDQHFDRLEGITRHDPIDIYPVGA